MKNLLTTLVLILTCQIGIAQVGTIKTEQYQAEFEKKMSIDSVPEYNDTIKIPIQILKNCARHSSFLL